MMERRLADLAILPVRKMMNLDSAEISNRRSVGTAPTSGKRASWT